MNQMSNEKPMVFYKAAEKVFVERLRALWTKITRKDKETEAQRYKKTIACTIQYFFPARYRDISSQVENLYRVIFQLK